jgi:vacuolar-type H+-ATPase subunit I/STV1
MSFFFFFCLPLTLQFCLVRLFFGVSHLCFGFTKGFVVAVVTGVWMHFFCSHEEVAYALQNISLCYLLSGAFSAVR